MAASNVRSWSTSSIPTATGQAISDGRISWPGNFGENFTVELADTEVCIGDRFTIGGAVVEVSQPRDTCYRVGIRLNHPPGM
jgi:MOSC domain-containing protein YiiM